MAEIIGQRTLLEFYNSQTQQRNWNEGKVGMWERSPTVSHSYETFVHFDLSSITGAIGSVRLVMVTTNPDPMYEPQGDVKLFEPVNANHSVWDNNQRAPKYDDIPFELWTEQTSVIDSVHVAAGSAVIGDFLNNVSNFDFFQIEDF